MSRQSLEVICRFSGSNTFSTALGVLVAGIESKSRNDWIRAYKVRNRGYLAKTITRGLGLLALAKNNIITRIRRSQDE